MHTRNEIVVKAPVEACLQAAADVERWPEILPHYRQVRFRRKDGFGRGRVYMAAYRHFGPLPYPVWWESEMATDRDAAEVRYHHVDGITRGMDVVWRLEAIGAEGERRPGPGRDPGRRAARASGAPGGDRGAAHSREPPDGGQEGSARRTRIVVLHDWEGPGWPLVGGIAAERVIGPHFIEVVADRTLAGVRREAERRSRRQAAARQEEAAASRGDAAPEEVET